VKVYRADNRDAGRNLAVEEWLLDRAETLGPVLFLCRNDPAMVIGKNQNPWREIDLDAARLSGARVARRVSGGGTVYHDAGNLNYSFIVPRTRYDAAAQFAAVIRALAACGVAAEIGNRTNLCAGGRKISGNAFCLKARVAMHHGTLLVRTDLDRMRRLIPDPPPQVEGHAVPSVPATVANLANLAPGLTFEALERALADAAASMWGGPVETLTDSDTEAWDWADIRCRHESWEWVYGRTPPFRMRLAGAALAGTSIVAHVVDGRLAGLAFDPPRDRPLPAALIGAPFDPAALARAAECPP